MAQFARPTLDPAVDDGITLSTKLMGVFPALYTNHAGPAAPPSPEKGQIWVDTSAEAANPPLLVSKQYTGTVWQTLGTLNLTTGLYTTAGGLPSTGGIVTGPIRFPFGAVAAPSITFDGDTDTGIWRAAADQIAFSTAGVQRVLLTSTNMDTSIATMRIQNANPAMVLDKATGASGTSLLAFRSNGSSRWAWNVSGAESTGDAGSNLFLQLFNDAGALTVNFLQFTRSARQLGVNGAPLGTAPLTVRTIATAAAEDALELVNVNVDVNGSVGLNLRTAGGALRGAIRGVRPGNNNGDIQVFSATGGVLNLAATFRANSDLNVEGEIENPSVRIQKSTGRGPLVKGAYPVGAGFAANLVEAAAVGASKFVLQCAAGSGAKSYTLITDDATAFVFLNNVNINRGFDNATATFSIPSDERMKENIETTKVDALADILALRAVTFDWRPETKMAKAYGPNVPLGLIAQEVQKHIPSAIRVIEGHGDEAAPPDMHIVENAALVPYLIRAIQQQQEQIAELTVRVAALEGVKP